MLHKLVHLLSTLDILQAAEVKILIHQERKVCNKNSYSFFLQDYSLK